MEERARGRNVWSFFLFLSFFPSLEFPLWCCMYYSTNMTSYNSVQPSQPANPAGQTSYQPPRQQRLTWGAGKREKGEEESARIASKHIHPSFFTLSLPFLISLIFPRKTPNLHITGYLILDKIEKIELFDHYYEWHLLKLFKLILKFS